MSITQQQLQQALKIIQQASIEEPQHAQKQKSNWAYRVIGFVFLAGCAGLLYAYVASHGWIKTEEESYVSNGISLSDKQESRVKSRLKDSLKLINLDKSRKIADQIAVEQTEAEYEALNNGIVAKFKQKLNMEQNTIAKFKCSTGIGECPVAKDINEEPNIYQAEGTPIINRVSKNLQINNNVKRKPQFSFQQAMGIGNANASEFSKLGAPPAYKASKKETKRQLQDLGKSDPIKGLIALNGGIQ